MTMISLRHLHDVSRVPRQGLALRTAVAFWSPSRLVRAVRTQFAGFLTGRRCHQAIADPRPPKDAGRGVQRGGNNHSFLATSRINNSCSPGTNVRDLKGKSGSGRREFFRKNRWRRFNTDGCNTVAPKRLVGAEPKLNYFYIYSLVP